MVIMLFSTISVSSFEMHPASSENHIDHKMSMKMIKKYDWTVQYGLIFCTFSWPNMVKCQ